MFQADPSASLYRGNSEGNCAHGMGGRQGYTACSQRVAPTRARNGGEARFWGFHIAGPAHAHAEWGTWP